MSDTDTDNIINMQENSLVIPFGKCSCLKTFDSKSTDICLDRNYNIKCLANKHKCVCHTDCYSTDLCKSNKHNCICAFESNMCECEFSGFENCKSKIHNCCCNERNDCRSSKHMCICYYDHNEPYCKYADHDCICYTDDMTYETILTCKAKIYKCKGFQLKMSYKCSCSFFKRYCIAEKLQRSEKKYEGKSNITLKSMSRCRLHGILKEEEIWIKYMKNKNRELRRFNARFNEKITNISRSDIFDEKKCMHVINHISEFRKLWYYYKNGFNIKSLPIDVTTIIISYVCFISKK